jgi:hypothetical protein
MYVDWKAAGFGDSQVKSDKWINVSIEYTNQFKMLHDFILFFFIFLNKYYIIGYN